MNPHEEVWKRAKRHTWSQLVVEASLFPSLHPLPVLLSQNQQPLCPFAPTPQSQRFIMTCTDAMSSWGCCLAVEIFFSRSTQWACSLTLDAKVPCGHWSKPATIWPVWFASSSIACHTQCHNYCTARFVSTEGSKFDRDLQHYQKSSFLVKWSSEAYVNQSCCLPACQGEVY